NREMPMACATVFRPLTTSFPAPIAKSTRPFHAASAQSKNHVNMVVPFCPSSRHIPTRVLLQWRACHRKAAESFDSNEQSNPREPAGLRVPPFRCRIKAHVELRCLESVILADKIYVKRGRDGARIRGGVFRSAFGSVSTSL